MKSTITKKYYYAYGRRKNAFALVRVYQGEGQSTINGKPMSELVPSKLEQKKIIEPLLVLEKEKNYYFSAKTKGGGVNGQREAIRLGIAKALVKENPENKRELKVRKFLTRDSRMVERKHTGLIKARKAPQYSKR